MTDVVKGWELSDSDNDEDIFQLTIEASMNLEDEGEPGAAAPPVSSQPVSSDAPVSGEDRQPSHPNGTGPAPLSQQKQNGHFPASRTSSRRLNDHRTESRRFGRRGETKDRRRGDNFGPVDDGFDELRYSMSFPTSPPFCAWFGNVTLDTNGNDLEEELYNYFAELDLEPKEIRFGNSRGGHNNKTCCFVDFLNADDLRHALTQIDSEQAPRFYNYKLLVDIAEPRSTVSRFGGRGKRRSRHSAGPISVGNDEFHSHVNSRNRRRPPDSPSRGRGGDFGRRRGSGRGAANGSMDRRSPRHMRNGTPRSSGRLSRNVSNESSINDDSDEMDFERRRADRDAYKVNGFDGPRGVRNVRPSGPNRHQPRRDFDEPRHVRSNPRQERRANPRQNFNHSKRRPGTGRAPKSRNSRSSSSSSNAPRSANPRFSKMFG